MSNVWAIAKITLAQAVRMKVALVVILMLAIMLPIMGVIVTGDGTLLGKLQTFSSYGISLTSMMLCFLVIALSCFTLNYDIKNKHIFTIITKPIKRNEILLGKFFGLVILNGGLLLIFSALIYTFTVLMPRLTEVDQEQLEQVQNEFFTSRIAIQPGIDMDKIEKEAEKELEKLIASQAPIFENRTRAQVLRMLIGQKKLEAKTVEPGSVLKWEFNNVKIENLDEPIFIRFKYDVSVDPPDLNIYSRWIAGDLRSLEKGEKPKTRIFDSYLRKDIVRTAKEIKMPADVVGEDGYLEIAFQNVYYNNTTVIPQEVEILYKSDMFTVNYFRAVGMIMIRLVFLAALGVALSTWLSFPVAIFVSLVFYQIGMTNGFIVESIESLSIGMELIYSLTIKPLMSLLPRFDDMYNPAPMIVAGRTISWYFLMKAFIVTAVIKSSLIFLFGMLVFSRREIARVTV